MDVVDASCKGAGIREEEEGVKKIFEKAQIRER